MPSQRTKRHQRSSTPEIDEAPTTNLFIDTVLELVPDCNQHEGAIGKFGYPCYYVEGVTQNYIVGVCDHRARKAGFVGEISPQSRSTGRRPNIR